MFFLKTKREQAVQSFINLDRLHRTVFDTAAGQDMHRGQHFVLACLSHMEGNPNQAALAKELNISPPAVAMALKRLEESGYITRAPDPADRRNTVISITDKGKTAVTTTHEIFTAIDLGMFDGMRDEMLSTFVEALQVMQDNLRQIYSQLKGDKTT